MEEKKEIKLTKGQEIGASVAGILNGFGAGLLVGGILNGVVEATPYGKALKLIMKCGAFGLQILTTKAVMDASENWVKNAIASVEKTKLMMNSMKQPKQEGPVEADGAVT